jgi:predicted NBD/HSP70 family sugar kinase
VLRVTNAVSDEQPAPDAPINLRNLGRVRVLQALADTGRLSRPDLVRRTGLARATVGSVVADLIAAGLLTEHGTDAPDGVVRTGRPAQTLSLVPTAAYAAGVDIGHDHVRAVLCDLVGEPVWDHSTDIDVDDAPQEVLSLATDLIGAALEESGISQDRVLGLGVGIASPVDQRAGLLRADGIMPGWVGIRPGDELTARTGLPTRLVNDANAGVLAERRYGVAQHSENVVYIRLSSGIGSGVVCDGRTLLGSDGMAGELGHVVVERDGAVCRCGNRGCLETVASPTAIAALLSRSWHRAVSTSELPELIAAKDRGTLRAIEDAGDAVGRALAFTVMILNPQLIVVGGELAATGDALFDPMRRAIGRNSMSSHTSSLQIVASALGDSAGVRGAAALVLEEVPERLAAMPAG